MRIIIITICCFVCLCTSAQDTSYYGIDGKQVKSHADCHYYQVVQRIESDTTRAIFSEYYKSGQIRSEEEVLYKFKISTGGKIREWYDNGQLRREYSFKGVNLDGPVVTYYKNGSLRRKDLYNEGVLIKGQSFSQDSIEVDHTDFLRKAEFPGGLNELMNYLSKEVKYPKQSIKSFTEGTVRIQFDVLYDGKIANIAVLEGVDSKLDAEAVRVVKKMPKWRPQMIEGEIVVSRFILPITFTLTNN